MPAMQAEQRSPEWLAARRGRITASTAAAILGMNPHEGPLAAYNKIQGVTELTNKHMAWGVEFEKRAIACYEIETGNIAHTCGFWIHEEHNWLGASPDGTVRADGLVEVKCPSVLPESIPLHHRIQMLMQLECTGRKWCDYFSWAGDDKTFLARVWRCRGALTLIKRLHAWYDLYVVHQTPPPRSKSKGKA